MSKKKVLVISGPNLNLIGNRENNIYGNVTLKEIHLKMEDIGTNKNLLVVCKQSNSETEIIDFIQDDPTINHTNKTQLRKMMPLGDNLRADDNICLTGANAFNGIAHSRHPAHIR